MDNIMQEPPRRAACWFRSAFVIVQRNREIVTQHPNTFLILILRGVRARVCHCRRFIAPGGHGMFNFSGPPRNRMGKAHKNIPHLIWCPASLSQSHQISSNPDSHPELLGQLRGWLIRVLYNHELAASCAAHHVRADPDYRWWWQARTGGSMWGRKRLCIETRPRLTYTNGWWLYFGYV